MQPDRLEPGGFQFVGETVRVERRVHRVPRQRVRELKVEMAGGRQRGAGPAEPDARRGQRAERGPGIAARGRRLGFESRLCEEHPMGGNTPNLRAASLRGRSIGNAYIMDAGLYLMSAAPGPRRSITFAEVSQWD